mgnify:CR=1 FL=1
MHIISQPIKNKKYILLKRANLHHSIKEILTIT